MTAWIVAFAAVGTAMLVELAGSVIFGWPYIGFAHGLAAQLPYLLAGIVIGSHHPSKPDA